jgi:hypothetical protein
MQSERYYCNCQWQERTIEAEKTPYRLRTMLEDEVHEGLKAAHVREHQVRSRLREFLT